MNKITKGFNNLTSEDLYSLILFSLYKMDEVPEYSTLSELAYILDKNNLLKLLKQFGGTTITIPYMSDLKLMAACLLLYERVNIEGNDFNSAVSSLDISSEFNLSKIKKAYFSLCKVMEKYNFNGRKDNTDN